MTSWQVQVSGLDDQRTSAVRYTLAGKNIEDRSTSTKVGEIIQYKVIQMILRYDILYCRGYISCLD
jgi:hypothetical protein